MLNHFQELSKKALIREESFQNVAVAETEETGEPDAEHGADLKRKKVRSTTGDLAKFLRTEHQDQIRNSDPLSPHGNYSGLHPDHQMLSNAASLYSLTTDITGTTGIGKKCHLF